MKIIADIHLHSHFSRATSKNLNLENLYKWAQLKGIHVVGTGDIAHPGWLDEMRQKLETAEDGLFRLKSDFARPIQDEVFKACHGEVRFMLAGEISNIYKKYDKVRKIHNVVFMPSFDAVEKFQSRLEQIGNIRSDGRPILGLDSRDLLEIVLETDPQGYLIPAHIWTPWFAMLGSKSGFDSVEECFADLTDHIFALETGLSSDPLMNWRLSILDNYTLVSNSDAHSPPKLGREANVFDTELSYTKIFSALKTGDPEKFLGTIEFFPEEGKYHYDGHRKCGVRWDPKTTLAHKNICPECGRAVTVGVMHRVEALADREPGEKPDRTHPFRSFIPLPEVIAGIHSVGVNTKRVNASYEMLLNKLGSEFTILEEVPLEDLEKIGGAMLAEAIRRMRAGDVKIAAGFDGEFGKITLFDENERDRFSSQLAFFAEASKNYQNAAPNKAEQRVSDSSETTGYVKSGDVRSSAPPPKNDDKNDQTETKQQTGKPEQDSNSILSLNPEQQAAAEYFAGPLMISAGPGTGKTRTLTQRIANLVQTHAVNPENILAVTFTHKAAQEMSTRLQLLLEADTARLLTVKTFHAFGAQILRNHGEGVEIDTGFSICTEQDRKHILKNINPDLKAQEIEAALKFLSDFKNSLLLPDDANHKEALQEDERPQLFSNYQRHLQENQLLDYDDLLYYPVKLFQNHPDSLTHYQERFKWISVDEYQDINLAQYTLLRLLTSAGTNLCVIGDPDQAIYGFRGANRDFFLRFTEDFPRAKTIALTRNYRSSQEILAASYQIISKGGDSASQHLSSDFISNTKIHIYQAPTDKAEAEYVVHQIEKMVGGTSYFSIDSGRVEDDERKTHSFSDFAVLYRLNAQVPLLETAFKRSGMPYQSSAESSFYERPPVDTIIDFLSFAHNPDANYFMRKLLLKTKTGIGPTTYAKLESFAKERKLSLWDAVNLAVTHRSLGNAQREATARFGHNANSLIQKINATEITESIDLIIELFLPLKEDTKTDDSVGKLKLRAKPFGRDLPGFLETAALKSRPVEIERDGDRVALMTMHSAKGLEFPVVFIVGCEESIIPYERNVDSTEEERRLFYVAMTRAKERLILIHSKSRFLYGKRVHNKPSSYINDVESALKEHEESVFKAKKKEKDPVAQIELF